ncbi:MAG: L,D-transpeptidase [Beijerinckiaceae bacterium]
MRFRLLSAVAVAAGMLMGLASAEARVRVSVNLTSQTMHVSSSSGNYSWKISSGRMGYGTPNGTYRPQSLRRMHYSRKYNMSPMPYSIFFRGGYAIHGTGAVGRLGSPASHGCIRLHTANAAKLFAMVKREGATITITGSHHAYYAKNKGSKRYASAKKSNKSYASLKKSKKSKRYLAKAKTSKKYFAKGGKAKTKYASKRSRSAPLAYAPVNKPKPAFDFFRNPNNPWR